MQLWLPKGSLLIPLSHKHTRTPLSMKLPNGTLRHWSCCRATRHSASFQRAPHGTETALLLILPRATVHILGVRPTGDAGAAIILTCRVGSRDPSLLRRKEVDGWNTFNCDFLVFFLWNSIFSLISCAQTPRDYTCWQSALKVIGGMVLHCSARQSTTYAKEEGMSFHFYPKDKQLREVWLMIKLRLG